MKKKTGIIIGGFLALMLTFTTGVYANELYHNWKGTEDYEDTKENLSLIEYSFNQLVKTKDDLVVENVSLKNKNNELQNKTDELSQVITEKDILLVEANNKIKNNDLVYAEAKKQLTQIISDTNNQNGKGNRYDILAKKVNDLAGYMEVPSRINEKVGNGEKSKELEQAEKDMKDLKETSDKLLEEIEGQK